MAFVVCRSLGIDSADYSFGYVACWAGVAALYSATAAWTCGWLGRVDSGPRQLSPGYASRPAGLVRAAGLAAGVTRRKMGVGKDKRLAHLSPFLRQRISAVVAN